MSQNDENDLIRQAQAGEREAFVVLYDRHQPAIYTYLYYRVSDQATAEELTGEVFCRMVENISRYQPQGKPILAWLYAIARNLAADHHRQQSRAIELPLDERLQSGEGDPVRETETNLSAECLGKALERLTDDQRLVILGKFVEGRSNADVAELLAKTEGAVKSLQHRALASLKRAIEEEGCYEA